MTGIKTFAGCMGGVIEKDPGGTVHLGNNDPFGAIYNKGSVVGHEGNITHIDLLFLAVPEGLVTGFIVNIINVQKEFDLQCTGIGHVPLLTFLDVKLGFFDFVTLKVHFGHPGGIPDREYRLEHSLKPHTI